MRCFFVLLLTAVLTASYAQPFIPPIYVPNIPSLEDDDVFYTPSRDDLYKVRMDSVAAYIDRTLSKFESFGVDADLGTAGNITDGDTLSVIGGVGIETSVAANIVTATLKLAEVPIDATLGNVYFAGYSVDEMNDYLYHIDSIKTYVLDGITGITDGDKGDITVSTGGTDWQINNDVVGPDELQHTAVVAGSYTNTDLTVDEDGRITAAANGTDNVLSEEQVQDYVGDMLVGNTETLIDVTYQDADGTIDFEVEPDLSNYTNDAGFLTGNETITLTGDVTGSGSTSITTSIQANTIGPTELVATTVSPGTYTNANITVDTDGRVTSASNGTTGVADGDYGDITVSGSGSFWNIDANTITATEIAAGAVGSSELASTAVSAGSYTNANITVDTDGRITSASNGSGGITGSGVTNRVAYWDSPTTLDDFPLALNGSRTEFTQSTSVQLPDGASFFEPSAGNSGNVRFDTDTDRFRGDDGSAWDNFMMDGNYWDEDYAFNTNLTVDADDFFTVQSIVTNSSVTGHRYFYLPNPTSAYRGKQIILYCFDGSGTYNIYMNAGGNGILEQGSAAATYQLQSQETVTLTLARAGSTSYYWMITARN